MRGETMREATMAGQTTKKRTAPPRWGGLFAVLALGLAACGPPADDPLEDQIEEAFERSMTPGMVALENYRIGAQRVAFPLRARTQVAGYLGMGDHASNYTGWLKGENPSLIVESVSMGDYGHGRSSYYFANALLSYYRSDQTILDVSDPTSPRRRLIMVEVGFTPLGEVGASRKLVDGEETPLEPAEIDAIYARGELLSDSVVVAYRRR
jgi:hypothetical protein